MSWEKGVILDTDFVLPSPALTHFVYNQPSHKGDTHVFLAHQPCRKQHVLSSHVLLFRPANENGTFENLMNNLPSLPVSRTSQKFLMWSSTVVALSFAKRFYPTAGLSRCNVRCITILREFLWFKIFKGNVHFKDPRKNSSKNGFDFYAYHKVKL